MILAEPKKDQTDRIQYIPIESIHMDQIFNCRGSGGVQAMDVVALSDSIKQQGLLSPIIIRTKDEEESKNPLYAQYEYFLVAGFRRYLACRMAHLKEVKCIVKTNLTRQEAFYINLTENLNRKQMTIDQEAYAINNLMKEGDSVDIIAKKLGMSVAWVNVRKLLLTLPVEIQAIARTGTLSTHHIQKIAKLPTKEAQIAKAEEIRSLVQDQGVKKSNIKLDKPKEGALKARKRTPSEISSLIVFLIKHFSTCLATRALAWSNGDIDNKALWDTIQVEANKHGKKINPPEDYSIPSDDVMS